MPGSDDDADGTEGVAHPDHFAGILAGLQILDYFADGTRVGQSRNHNENNPHNQKSRVLLRIYHCDISLLF